MDTNRFDSITRNLAAGDTRRGTLRKLAATGLGLGLARLGLGEAAAKKKKKKKPLNATCKKSKQCAGNLSCQVTEGDNQCGNDGQVGKTCCIPLGERCDYGCECCGTNVICNGHICETA